MFGHSKCDIMYNWRHILFSDSISSSLVKNPLKYCFDKFYQRNKHRVIFLDTLLDWAGNVCDVMYIEELSTLQVMMT